MHLEPEEPSTLRPLFRRACCNPNVRSCGFRLFRFWVQESAFFDRGREDRLGSRSPLPPNRTGGSPASGSPVSGFTSRRIDGPRPGRRQGAFSESAGAKGPDLHRKAINMRHQHCGQSGPSHVGLVQSVVLSRCRHSRYGSDLVACHVTSTFLRSFAQRALPRVFARMNALTPGRPALRVLIRDNEHRPCIRPGLPASRRRTFRPFRLQPPVAAPGVWFGFPPGPTAWSADHIPLGTMASLGLRLFLAGSPRQPAESSSSTYGLVVHLQLLPTPPRGDAVTFGYRVQTQLRRGLPPR